ncbi:MAG: hypothetical protein CL878_11640 [Dehalococcoidia bacterium]|nr:hypothetical protein [Dehalococcoidia bacterium]
MATERMRVLELIREGKVSVDEGVRLLEALGGEREAVGSAATRGRPFGEDLVKEIKINVGRVLSEDTMEDINKTVSKVVSTVTEAVGPHVRQDAVSGQRRREERLGADWQPLAAEDGEVPVSLTGRLLVESTGGSLVIAARPDTETRKTSDGGDSEATEQASPVGTDKETPAVETPEAAAWAEAGEPAPEASAWAGTAPEPPSGAAGGGPGSFATVEAISEGHNWDWYAVRRGADVIIAAYRTASEDSRMPTLKVTVPAQLAEVAARTGGGSIKTAGLDSPLDAQTSGGSIKIKDHGHQPVTARTSGGNISASGNPLQVKLRTSGGNVSFDGSTQEFDGKTSGGNLRLLGQIESVNAHTGGGSISIEGPRLTKGAHSAVTGGGQIQVLLAEDSSVSIEARASGGAIQADLPKAVTEPTTHRPGDQHYRGTIGEGAAHLDLKSAGGSIKIGVLSNEEPAG